MFCVCADSSVKVGIPRQSLLIGYTTADFHLKLAFVTRFHGSIASSNNPDLCAVKEGREGVKVVLQGSQSQDETFLVYTRKYIHYVDSSVSHCHRDELTISPIKLPGYSSALISLVDIIFLITVQHVICAYTVVRAIPPVSGR